jgi:hypothetical protein
MIKGNNLEFNKENLTPSNLRNSASKFNNHLIIENNIRVLSDQKDFLLLNMENNDAQNFRLTKKNEELISQVLEKGSTIFKHKAEYNYLNDRERETFEKKNSIVENLSHSNVVIENKHFSNFLAKIQLGHNQNFVIQLTNDFALTGVRQKENLNISKLLKTIPGHSVLNDSIEKGFASETNIIKAFTAFNII